MPVVYNSIKDEHNQVRTKAGLFDISHMGRLFFRGADRVTLLDQLLTNNVSSLKPGQIRYSLILNDDGCILDDVLIYRIREDEHLLVVNASNRTKIVNWINQHLSGDVTLDDQTLATTMIALQGPDALAVLKDRLGLDASPLKYYFGQATTVLGEPAILSRTGYTGEDGVELIVPNKLGTQVWNTLLGDDDRCKPIGLGARDTLRLEAAMPLYGHELSESIDPIQANVAWACPLSGKDFIGKAALAKRPADRQVRVGIKVEQDQRIAREGYTVVSMIGGTPTPIGTVTSGTQSPTLGRSIAMGYVDPAFSAVGTKIAVDMRGTPVPAEIVSLPFYARKKS